VERDDRSRAYERPLPGFEDRSRPDRYCDLILTGGVTSAIAYPAVVHGLAQVYRFNAIGGSSSGAGSAALAAAAEFRRRRGSSDGYRTLLRRTAEVKNQYGGQTGLTWLFQPEPGSQRLFRVLVSFFAGTGKRCHALCKSLVRNYRSSLFTGFFAAAYFPAALAWLSGAEELFGWVLLAFFLGLAGGFFRVGMEVLQDLYDAADRDFGLCSGQKRLLHAPHEPLTPWLHDLIQDIAGLPPDRPLTFADLKSAPGGPQESLGETRPDGVPSIDLRMFASNITLGRPLLLPLGPEDPPLYFKPAEMERLFPKVVVDAMKLASRTEAIPELELWELPRDKLPVVVAARMSVSFPVLFSAVPLWQRTPVICGPPYYRRLLVVDGGLCSNFPIHLFDSPLPAWPTFGVSLVDSGGAYSLKPQDIAARVQVAQSVYQAAVDRASRFGELDSPYARLKGYGLAIFSTVKDWNDAMLAELPGVRERVAHVGLPDDIGGLNILMNEAQIECLAQLGGEVARQLLNRYAVPDGDGAHAPGWREHRWIRLNVLNECLRDSLLGLAKAAQHAPHAEPLLVQIQAAVERPPLKGWESTPLQPAQAAALERLLESLQDIEYALTPRPQDRPCTLKPRPVLRMRPPL
jgi:predicted acylesterase/phospholipase RssA